MLGTKPLNGIFLTWSQWTVVFLHQIQIRVNVTNRPIRLYHHHRVGIDRKSRRDALALAHTPPMAVTLQT